MAQQLIERPPDGERSEASESVVPEWIARVEASEITVPVGDGDVCRIRLPTTATEAEIAAVTAAISTCTGDDQTAVTGTDGSNDRPDRDFWSTSARLSAIGRRSTDRRSGGDAWRLAGRPGF